MALQVVSPAVSVYKVLGVKDGAEEVKEYTFKRGELLPDWVNSHQQFVLTQTGMVRQVGDFPDPSLVAADRLPAPVLLPEHNPLAVVGDFSVTSPQVVVGTGSDDAPARAEGELPADSDTKPVWERAALDFGLTRPEAESMKKADLVREVKTRKANADKQAAAADQDPPRDEDAALPPSFARGGSAGTPTPASEKPVPAKADPKNAK